MSKTDLIVKNYANPIPYILINNLYTEEELKLIWNEINFLCSPNRLQGRNYTGASKVNAKNNRGVFLDDLYTDIKKSDIGFLCGKILKNDCELLKNNKESWFFRNFCFNKYNVLLSYYENGGFYKPHIDSSYATAITWFFKEPKKFSGGDLIFTDYDTKINIENNMCIIFPSCIKHEVSTVNMDSTHSDNMDGRVSINQFIYAIDSDLEKFNNQVNFIGEYS